MTMILRPTDGEPVVTARSVGHDFGTPENPMPVLFDVDFQVRAGEIVLLTGPSGSGKTTLLTLIGALRTLHQGSMTVLDQELAQMPEPNSIALRRRLGFIFQSHNLFESLTAMQNVLLALNLHDEIPPKRRELRAREMLEAVGLGDRLDYKPEALSGGQRQRVAVARALAPRPPLILADEPTAALDAENGKKVIDLLRTFAAVQNTATVLVTHDQRVLEAADRIVHMIDGRIVSDVRVLDALEISEFLQKIPAFEHFSPSEIVETAEQMALERRKDGSVIFKQGDEGDQLYIVRSGNVRVVQDGQDIALLGKGDFFGEMSLLSGNPRNATVIVEEQAELLTLDKDAFQRASEHRKSFQDQLLTMYANRS